MSEEVMVLAAGAILVVLVLYMLVESPSPSRKVRCLRCGGSGSRWVREDQRFVRCPTCQGMGLL